MELRNQYRIIRTTELVVAKEKLNEIEKHKEEILNLNSPASLLQRIQEFVNKTDEESENLHHVILDRETLEHFCRNTRSYEALTTGEILYILLLKHQLCEHDMRNMKIKKLILCLGENVLLFRLISFNSWHWSRILVTNYIY